MNRALSLTALARPSFALGGWLMRLDALRRSRRALADMSDHQLRDIGLDRETADAEANRPFWDAPPHWRG